MKWYKISVSYDGTNYYGWQVQKDLPTIAYVMQERFFKVFKKKIVLRGASRTDAGVHALGHVSFFSTEINCSTEKLLFAWNNILPKSMYINSLQEVSYSGHPHAHIDHKIYWYHFFTQHPFPLVARYGWYVREPIDIERLRDVLQLFVGIHDFSNFCDREVTGSTIRTITSIDLLFIQEYAVWRVVITGHSFLRYMVRRMVGAAVSVVNQKSFSKQDILDALALRGVRKPFVSAPSCGLMLHSIMYKEQIHE